MPSGSHPLALRAEEEINKLKTWETSSSASTLETICSGLGGLGELYNCIDYFLQLPLTQQTIARHQREKWAEEVVNGSVQIQLLDVCSATSEILLSVKEQAQGLQIALRRRGGQEVDAYIHSRKKVKQDVTKLLGQLKRMDNKRMTPPLLDPDQHLSMTIKFLKDLKAVTISILRASSSFLSTSRQKPSRWSFVSKLKCKGHVASEGEAAQMNELENADVAFSALCQNIMDKSSEIERVQTAQKCLKALETGIKDIETRLESLFRHLILIRVSLLNSLSC